MLNVQDLEKLINLLKDKNEPFESLAAHFYKAFPKSEQFKAGCAICMLLQDNLLALNERMVGFFLLYDMYRQTSAGTSPFVPVVLDTLEATTEPVAGRAAAGRAELRALTFGGAVWDVFREIANCGDPVGTLWGNLRGNLRVPCTFRRGLIGKFRQFGRNLAKICQT